MGPTAVGKSRLALELAPRFEADIITADSRQVYRYMDIGTAKPTPAERAAVRHYMLDLVEPDDVYTAARFREEGSRALDRIAAEQRVAFVVGGTGFYVRALLQGLAMPAVEPDPALRDRLRAEAAEHGSHSLHRRLKQLDADSARRIHPSNLPRIIRALEIIERLGGPVPAPSDGTELPALYVGLHMDRFRLNQFADRRVESQVESGLVEETRLLLSMGYGPQSPALSGFAYRQMIAYLRGEMTLAEAVADYQRATRQYIRRQMTWFRSDSRIRWLDAAEDPAEAAAQAIESWLTKDVSA